MYTYFYHSVRILQLLVPRWYRGALVLILKMNNLCFFEGFFILITSEKINDNYGSLILTIRKGLGLLAHEFPPSKGFDLTQDMSHACQIYKISSTGPTITAKDDMDSCHI